MANQTNLSLQEQEEQEHYNQVKEQEENFVFTSPFSTNVTNFIIFLLICLAIYLIYEHVYKGSDGAVPVVPSRLNTFYF